MVTSEYYEIIHNGGMYSAELASSPGKFEVSVYYVDLSGHRHLEFFGIYARKASAVNKLKHYFRCEVVTWNKIDR